MTEYYVKEIATVLFFLIIVTCILIRFVFSNTEEVEPENENQQHALINETGRTIKLGEPIYTFDKNSMALIEKDYPYAIMPEEEPYTILVNVGNEIRLAWVSWQMNSYRGYTDAIAIRWTGSNSTALEAWSGGDIYWRGCVLGRAKDNVLVMVNNREVSVNKGDWIVKNESGYIVVADSDIRSSSNMVVGGFSKDTAYSIDPKKS